MRSTGGVSIYFRGAYAPRIRLKGSENLVFSFSKSNAVGPAQKFLRLWEEL